MNIKDFLQLHNNKCPMCKADIGFIKCSKCPLILAVSLDNNVDAVGLPFGIGKRRTGYWVWLEIDQSYYVSSKRPPNVVILKMVKAKHFSPLVKLDIDDLQSKISNMPALINKIKKVMVLV